MKNIFYKIFFAGIALFAVSCNIKPYYATEGVTLEMKILRVGAGFCHVKVEASDDAWYLLGVCLEDECPKSEEAFKEWAVQNALSKYDAWKKEYVKENAFMIADFASHSLKYGDTETFFNYLKNGYDYRVFCFVMDPETKKPVGSLYSQKMRTNYVSHLGVIFDYRVKGYWDYVYPKDKESDKLLSDIPWVAMTADSLDIRESGAETPLAYFMNRFDKQIEEKSLRILYGMYAYNNDGIGDMGDAVCFEEGHTYYTCVASYDCWLADFANYKFTWTGPDMEILLKEKDDCYGGWTID